MYELKDWINLDYLNKDKQFEINKSYNLVKPYEYLSLDNFLKEDKINKIFEALKKEKYYLEDSDLYQFFRTHDFKNSKNNKIIQDFRNFLLSENFIQLIENLTTDKIKRNKLTLHSLKFKKTNYLLCHDDVVQNRLHAFLLSLTKNWEKGMGGEFEIFDSDNNGEVLPKIISKVEPKYNRFYLFKVQKKSYHSVAEVTSDIDRLTIGGWYYK